jgi:hypothetical protein
VVLFNSASVTTTYISANQLSIQIAAGLAAGTYPVVVSNPTPGGGASAPVLFTVVPQATIVSLSPNTKVVGSAAFTLTVTGTNFVAASVVTFNGTPLTTTYLSATQLSATVPAAALATVGVYNVTVVSPVNSVSAPASFSVTTGTATQAGQDLAGFALYPNPTRGMLTIELPTNWTSLNQPVRLTDLTGRVVLQARLAANGRLDLGTLATGVYLLTVGEGQQSVTRRIVKE